MARDAGGSTRRPKLSLISTPKKNKDAGAITLCFIFSRNHDEPAQLPAAEAWAGWSVFVECGKRCAVVPHRAHLPTSAAWPRWTLSEE